MITGNSIVWSVQPYLVRLQCSSKLSPINFFKSDMSEREDIFMYTCIALPLSFFVRTSCKAVFFFKIRTPRMPSRLVSYHREKNSSNLSGRPKQTQTWAHQSTCKKTWAHPSTPEHTRVCLDALSSALIHTQAHLALWHTMSHS